ncbi:MAG TPA: hypothetical protein VF517_02180 [Thermoleophilaceae bacterium]
MEAPPPGARFRFVQFEFAFPLGPADGRYMTRADPEAEPERVLVLRTSGAAPRPLVGRRRARRSGGDDGPLPVPVVRATVIDAEPLETDAGAAEWLDRLRRDRDALEAEAGAAARDLNALLRAHRAAALDPSARDVAPSGANVVRVGYGSGEQVADGHFAEAYELPLEDDTSKVRRRAAALAPDERLAAILGGRDELLACEELVLRARADLDAARPREAALQARIALEALLAELGGDAVGDLAADREPVGRAANEALAGSPGTELSAAVAAAVGRMETALRRRRLGHVTNT